jgi:hypothetical protein
MIKRIHHRVTEHAEEIDARRSGERIGYRFCLSDLTEDHDE